MAKKSNKKSNVKFKKTTINSPKKSNVSVSTDFDIKGFVIVVVSIVLVMVIAYLLTVLAKNTGLFDEHYVKPTVTESTISYDNILGGTIFTRPESDYYVLITDSESNDSIYASSLGSEYASTKEGRIKLYKVDLNDDMNKYMISDSSNPSAQTASDLRVNGNTLIKISNGRNIKYVEGDESIKAELGI